MPHVRGALHCLLLLFPLLLLGAGNGAGRPGSGLVPAVHILAADDAMYRLAADGGYERVVQVFPWRDLQPVRDQWHWQQPDFAVRAAEYYGLGLIVRLGHPPEWALSRSSGAQEAPIHDLQDLAGGSQQPADESAAPAESGQRRIDPDAYADFVAAVARRYRGQVDGYIIWNEPNLSREWAGQAPDPAAYTALLCRAYHAIKAVDPAATVASAGLAPTNGSDGALDDRAYLLAMLEAGAGACFDVLGAHAYGFGHPPDDPRGAHDGLNLARLLDLRDIMAASGGGATPIWITEMGWTTNGLGADVWQTVTAEQQARYLAAAWQQIKTGWPWVRMVTVWNLSRDLPDTDEMGGYSLLAADGSPIPAYDALRDLLAGEQHGRLGDGYEGLPVLWRSPPQTEIPILAVDEVVHLGDNQ